MTTLVLLGLAACAAAMDFDADPELLYAEDVGSMRTFAGFNSTTALVALGAIAIIGLVVAGGLYLLGGANLGRTDPLPDPNYNVYNEYYGQQYQNAEQAYPYAQQQQQQSSYYR